MAGFAASAYAKLSGRLADCLAITGPVATNLLSGLWYTKLDRVPVPALTGQVDFQFLGLGAFQEVNLAAAFEAVSCCSQKVLESGNLSELNDGMKNLFAHDGPATLGILTDAELI